MKNLINTRTLAERWGMHEKSLVRWRSQGKGPKFLKLGEAKNATVFYRLSDVTKWEKENMRSFG